MYVAVVLALLAQPPVPSANVLTLEQALQTAEKQNLDLVAARERLEQAQLLVGRVWSNYLPTISAGGSYTYNNIEATIPFVREWWVRDVTPQKQGDDFNPSRELGTDNPPGAATNLALFPKEVIEAPIQRHHQLGARVQLQQAIIAPALWPAIQSANIAVKVADLSVENARREILFGVVQLYYGAAALREVTEIQERLLESRRAHEKNARIRFDAGAVPRIVLLRAQIDLARTEQDARRARNSYQAAKISLATLLDRDVNFEVAQPPEPQPVAAPTSEETLGRRPDVAAAAASVELAQKQRTATWFKFLPNLGLTAQYQWANVTGFTGRNDSWSVGLGLNWLIWDGGLREVELKETASKITEAQANQRNTENKVRAEVEKALLEVESARANSSKAQEQLKLARENAQLVDVNFQAGAATYLDVSDANTALLTAELSALTERLNAQLAQLSVAKAAGLFAAK